MKDHMEQTELIKTHTIKRIFSILLFFITILILVATGLSTYSFIRYKDATAFISYFFNKDKFQSLEDARLITLLQQSAIVPEETPTVATVTDKEKLSNQTFFKQAQNGDLVYLFSEAKKAYLFRPSTKQIVEIGPLNIQKKEDEKQDVIPNGTTLALYNGTTTIGLTSTFQEMIMQKTPQVLVEVKANASNTSYEKSMIIPVEEKYQGIAKTLSTLLSIPISEMPQGEQVPNTHILIILGNDLAKK